MLSKKLLDQWATKEIKKSELTQVQGGFPSEAVRNTCRISWCYSKNLAFLTEVFLIREKEAWGSLIDRRMNTDFILNHDNIYLVHVNQVDPSNPKELVCWKNNEHKRCKTLVTAKRDQAIESIGFINKIFDFISDVERYLPPSSSLQTENVPMKKEKEIEYNSLGLAFRESKSMDSWVHEGIKVQDEDYQISTKEEEFGSAGHHFLPPFGLKAENIPAKKEEEIEYNSLGLAFRAESKNMDSWVHEGIKVQDEEYQISAKKEELGSADHRSLPPLGLKAENMPAKKEEEIGYNSLGLAFRAEPKNMDSWVHQGIKVQDEEYQLSAKDGEFGSAGHHSLPPLGLKTENIPAKKEEEIGYNSLGLAFRAESKNMDPWLHERINAPRDGNQLNSFPYENAFRYPQMGLNIKKREFESFVGKNKNQFEEQHREGHRQLEFKKNLIESFHVTNQLLPIKRLNTEHGGQKLVSQPTFSPNLSKQRPQIINKANLKIYLGPPELRTWRRQEIPKELKKAMNFLPSIGGDVDKVVYIALCQYNENDQSTFFEKAKAQLELTAAGKQVIASNQWFWYIEDPVQYPEGRAFPKQSKKLTYFRRLASKHSLPGRMVGEEDFLKQVPYGPNRHAPIKNLKGGAYPSQFTLSQTQDKDSSLISMEPIAPELRPKETNLKIYLGPPELRTWRRQEIPKELKKAMNFLPSIGGDVDKVVYIALCQYNENDQSPLFEKAKAQLELTAAGKRVIASNQWFWYIEDPLQYPEGQAFPKQSKKLTYFRDLASKHSLPGRMVDEEDFLKQMPYKPNRNGYMNNLKAKAYALQFPFSQTSKLTYRPNVDGDIKDLDATSNSLQFSFSQTSDKDLNLTFLKPVALKPCLKEIPYPNLDQGVPAGSKFL